uniref:Uncharacterized protein n=1 Tax=Arundo donax TaxID=35708 RepID=A0A0A9QLM2_ARUDO
MRGRSPASPKSHPHANVHSVLVSP